MLDTHARGVDGVGVVGAPPGDLDSYHPRVETEGREAGTMPDTSSLTLALSLPHIIMEQWSSVMQQKKLPHSLGGGWVVMQDIGCCRSHC